MGRKIPKSSRHRKLKFVDPCSGRTSITKNNRLRNKPPAGEDYQEIPKLVQELMEYKNAKKNNALKKKKKKKKKIKDEFIIIDKDDDGIEESSESFIIQPGENETTSELLHRLQQCSNSAKRKTKNIDKCGDFFHIKDIDDNTQVVNKSKSSTPKRKTKKPKENSKKRKNIQEGDEEPKLEVEERKDHVKFGEVVLRPPSFTAKPRNAPQKNKAGKRNLNLKQLLPFKGQEADDAPEKKIVFGPKMKNLPPERRQVLEFERSKAVQMYRLLKGKKSVDKYTAKADSH